MNKNDMETVDAKVTLKNLGKKKSLDDLMGDFRADGFEARYFTDKDEVVQDELHLTCPYGHFEQYFSTVLEADDSGMAISGSKAKIYVIKKDLIIPDKVKDYVESIDIIPLFEAYDQD